METTGSWTTRSWAPPHAPASRASWRKKRKSYAEEGMIRAIALPELRCMSLVWRILLLWMAVLALFVIAGWVS